MYSHLSIADVLQLVVGLAAQTLHEMVGASVSIRSPDGGAFETASASSALVRDLDELQYGDQAGPCVEAIASGAEILVLTSEDRYPKFEAAAARAGVASVHSVPLLVDGTAVGALDLYSATVDQTQQHDSLAAAALATHSAIVLSKTTVGDKVLLASSSLTRALASRGVVGQAQGILMALGRIDADDAFDALRRASHRMDRKLRDVAAELVAQASIRPLHQAAGDADR